MIDLSEMLGNYFWIEDLTAKEDNKGLHISFTTESEEIAKKTVDHIADNLDMDRKSMKYNEGLTEATLKGK